MKKFEVGKIYKTEDGIEIQVLKRTDKTITYEYPVRNWWEADSSKTFRKKIDRSYGDYETIKIYGNWPYPIVHAISERSENNER